MLTLRQTVEYMNAKFPQQQLELADFDVSNKRPFTQHYPSYLFRGQRSIEWKTTHATIFRNEPLVVQLKSDIDKWIAGQHPLLGVQINNYTLYYFLREALWEKSCVDGLPDDFDVQQTIAGIMQHYGLDTAMIDLTADLHTAAFFASNQAVPGTIGQLMVVPTENLAGSIFNLAADQCLRARRQQAHALLGTSGLDLQSDNFKDKFNAKWFSFQLTDDDVKTFHNPTLLSIEGDLTARSIVNWYDHHIRGSEEISVGFKTYLAKKVNTLRIH